MIGATRAQIDEFLGQKRLAFAGVSRKPVDFSRMLWSELRRRGYDLVPVHPEAAEIDGVRAFPRVSAIAPSVDTVLLLTSGAVTDAVVRDCIAAGVKRIWFYRAVGKGSISEEALRLCQEHGVTAIPGECPFMFLEHTGALHRIHGFCRKLTGSYPA